MPNQIDFFAERPSMMVFILAYFLCFVQVLGTVKRSFSPDLTLVLEMGALARAGAGFSLWPRIWSQARDPDPYPGDRTPARVQATRCEPVRVRRVM